MEVGVGVFDELTCFPLSRLRERVPERSEGGRGKSQREFALSRLAPPAFATLSRKRERGREASAYADDSIYAALPVAMSSSASFTSSIWATATRLPSRTTRPVAMK